MGIIKKILDRELVGGSTNEEIYPISSTKAIYNEKNENLDYLLGLYLRKIESLYARQGFYVCDSNSIEPDKEIQINNFTLSTTIRLLVKMTKANIADDVSFEINNTGAYPLYYNEAPVSQDNSWEAGEVVDIYFDGIYFQAFKSKGKGDGEFWELRTDEEGNSYLYTDKNVAVKGGIVTYASIAPLIPSIYDNIPIDNDTIYWYTDPETNERYLKSKGGGLGNLTLIKENDTTTLPSDTTIFSAARTIKEIEDRLGKNGLWKLVEDEQGNKYIITDYNIVGKGGITAYYNEDLTPGGGGGLGGGSIANIEVVGEGNALSDVTLSEDKSLLTFTKFEAVEKSWLTEELKKYVDKESTQEITGLKDFINGLKIGSKLLNVVDGVLYINCDVAVTGGVTTYALGDTDVSTIMDGVNVDGITIIKENGILKVNGDVGGGASNWDELEGKPTWITNTTPNISIFNNDAGYITNSDLNGYATQSWVNSQGFATEDWITNKGYLTSSALNGYATQSWVNSNFLGISDTAVNADKVDGYHASGLLTSMSSSRSTNLSITVGGHTESLSTLHVDYAWQLENTRTIWGQNFDGTANVSGTLTSVDDIYGSGTFYSSNSKITNSLYIGGIRLYKSQTGVITIDGDLAVTGGITTYAQGSRTPSTIMDGVAVDGTTIKKVNGVLVATGGSGGGGSTAWDDITGKPLWLTTTKPNVSYFTNDAGYITQSQLGNTYVKKAGDAMTGALSTPAINGGGSTLVIGNSGNKSYVKFQEDVKQINGNWSISNSGSASFASVSASGVVRGDGGFITDSVTMLKLSRYAYQEVLTYGWTSTYGDFVDLKIPGSSQQTKYVKLSWNRGFEAFCNVVVNGNITATGGITGNTSDKRNKTILEELDINLKDIAGAPTIRFRWNGWKIKDDGKTHIGGLAQYIQKVLPEAVLNDDDMLYMDYSTTAYIFSVQTARHLLKTDTKLERLEKEIKRLKKQLKQLGYEEANIISD